MDLVKARNFKLGHTGLIWDLGFNEILLTQLKSFPFEINYLVLVFA